MRDVTENFIPVRAHIKTNHEAFKRFGAQWTPTILILDPDGTERHRIEGFLPADDFRAQLALGLAKRDFAHERYHEAEPRFRQVCEWQPEPGAAPEACYWAGVSAYKATDSPEPLADTARLLARRFPDSEWARKASVWQR